MKMDYKMMTYKIVEDGFTIVEESSDLSEKMIMKNIERILKRNCYKIERIEEKENEVIYYVY